MQIQKGTVQSTDGMTATVVPNEHPEIVTQPLIVPFHWGPTMGNIKAGEEVYFFEDGNHGGQIISRVDGKWDNTIRGPLTVTEDITAEAGIAAEKDVTAAGISLQKHTHTGDSGGITGAPQ